MHSASLHLVHNITHTVYNYYSRLPYWNGQMLSEAIIHVVNHDVMSVRTLSRTQLTLLKIHKLKYTPHFTCGNLNIVNLIVCNICDGGNYVGETGPEFHLQSNNPKKTMRGNSNYSMSFNSSFFWFVLIIIFFFK